MLIDDFDDDDIVNQQKEVSLAATKSVIGQHLQILAERLSLNMRVGRQADEIACIEGMMNVLDRYHQILTAQGVVTEEILKKGLADIYASSQLLTPDELAKQLQEIRKTGDIQINPDVEDGMD